MNNFGAALVKLLALAGGAAVGALLSRIYDEMMTQRAEERSQRDKMRYEQGLSALREQSQGQGQQPQP